MIASRTASLPPSWDGFIHDAERAHLPLADVAWFARTSESRERGGGSPQLFIYHLAVDRPAAAVALRPPASRIGRPLRCHCLAPNMIQPIELDCFLE